MIDPAHNVADQWKLVHEIDTTRALKTEEATYILETFDHHPVPAKKLLMGTICFLGPLSDQFDLFIRSKACYVFSFYFQQGLRT